MTFFEEKWKKRVRKIILIITIIEFVFLLLFYYYYYFWHARGMWKFTGQGWTQVTAATWAVAVMMPDAWPPAPCGSSLEFLFLTDWCMCKFESGSPTGRNIYAPPSQYSEVSTFASFRALGNVFIILVLDFFSLSCRCYPLAFHSEKTLGFCFFGPPLSYSHFTFTFPVFGLDQ